VDDLEAGLSVGTGCFLDGELEAVADQFVGLVAVPGQEQPLLFVRRVRIRVLREDFGGVPFRIDRDRHQTEVDVRAVLLQRLHRPRHQRTRTGTPSENEPVHGGFAE
jgi:hypothetical protein